MREVGGGGERREGVPETFLGVRPAKGRMMPTPEGPGGPSAKGKKTAWSRGEKSELK